MEKFFETTFQRGQDANVGDKSLNLIKNLVVPKSLFKYRSINEHTIELLRESSLFHAHKDSFTDPFDGINNFTLTFDEEDIRDLVSFFSGEKTKERQEQEIQLLSSNTALFEELVKEMAFRDIEKYGISCFSGKVDNALMWDHYADGHRGICIEFSFIEELQFVGKSIDDILDCNLPYFRKVNYEDDIPTIAYQDIGRERFSPAYHKASKYEYENEYRSIRPTIGSFPFHKSCLKGIYFGLRAKETDMKRLKTIMLDSGYGNTAFHRMTRQANSYDLGIEDA